MNTKIAKKVLMKNFYNSEFSSTKYAKIIGDIYHYTSVDALIFHIETEIKVKMVIEHERNGKGG